METSTIMWIVYLMNQVDIMRGVVHALSVILSLSVVVSLFVYGISEGSCKLPLFVRWGMGILGVVLIIFNLFLPTSATMKDIAIAYGVSEVLQSEQAKVIGDKIKVLSDKTGALLEKKLDKALGE